MTFDTNDHNIFLNRLDTRFGIKGTAPKWFKDYLTDHTQLVLIGNWDMDEECSDTIKLQHVVPQGSIPGPLLFTLYTTPLGDICRKYNLNYHIYADGTQLYIAFKPSTVAINE